jgi:hypothetical protein
MDANPDFGLAESRVLARREAHVARENEFAAYAPDAASNLGDADNGRFAEANEGIDQNREARRPYSCGDVPYLAGQIKMSEVEVGVGAFEDDDTEVLARVHPSEQILEAIVHRGIHDVEGRVIENGPPKGRCLLNHPKGRSGFVSVMAQAPETSNERDGEVTIFSS